jgi:hypothetical protein
MTVAASSGSSLEDVWQTQHDLMSELRGVEHWRRLVAARLDLAVAAVTSLDEPQERVFPTVPSPPSLPCGLKDIVGLPGLDEALGETAVLIRLRDVLRDLDGYADALRESTDEATRALVRILGVEP